MVRWSAIACFLASCGRLGFDPASVDAGRSTGPICGDGAVEGSEVCDDGNGESGDGCENDCKHTCTLDAQCDDGAACNGLEFCSPELHVCKLGEPQPDGTECGAMRLCRGGACALASCGDMNVDPAEDCDDGNLDEADGCENDCTFSCESQDQCADASICNGVELCDLAVHRCGPGTPPPRGTECVRGIDRAICRDEMCLPSVCGDGVVDPGASPPEQCDDENDTPGDGCEPDCTLSCTTDDDCDDGLVCNGRERCIDGRCDSAEPLPDGSDCGAGGECVGGVCRIPADAGTRDGGSAGCESDMDCPGARCCETCPGLPNECWGGLICPITKCLPDGGLES
jgi:cysteine-rich repeat protein